MRVAVIGVRHGRGVSPSPTHGKPAREGKTAVRSSPTAVASARRRASGDHRRGRHQHSRADLPERNGLPRRAVLPLADGPGDVGCLALFRARYLRSVVVAPRGHRRADVSQPRGAVRAGGGAVSSRAMREGRERTRAERRRRAVAPDRAFERWLRSGPALSGPISPIPSDAVYRAASAAGEERR